MTPNVGMITGNVTQLQREALDWLWLMMSGRATQDDLAAMERWKNQSAAHAQALATAAKTRRLIATQQSYNQVSPSLWQRPTTRRTALGGAAVAIAALGLVKPPMGMWPSFTELSSDYRTNVGERRRLALAQGISVEMNTRTSLSLKSTPGKPGLELIVGEIAMTADLPASHPIRVFAGRSRILASQASFDLRHDNGRVRVFCLDGTVKVEAGDGQAALKTNEETIIADNMIGSPAIVDPVLVTAWRQGRLVFHDTPFGDIVSEVNRYRSGRIIIANAELDRRRFNAVFEIAAVSKIVGDLQKFSNASATYLPGGIVVLA